VPGSGRGGLGGVGGDKRPWARKCVFVLHPFCTNLEEYYVSVAKAISHLSHLLYRTCSQATRLRSIRPRNQEAIVGRYVRWKVLEACFDILLPDSEKLRDDRDRSFDDDGGQSRFWERLVLPDQLSGEFRHRD
jgi:hypothetical protein